MADSFKLNEQTRKILIGRIKEEFPDRVCFPTDKSIPRYHKELFKLATVLGGNLNETIHYEVNGYPDHYVELHLFEGNKKEDSYECDLRKMLKEETDGKCGDIIWERWYNKEGS